MENGSMEFREKHFLSQRGPVDQLPDEGTDGTLLIGDPVATWKDSHNQFGHDNVCLIPAIYNGQRRFLLRRTWSSGPGYDVSGLEGEEILTQAESVQICLEKGQWGFFPKVLPSR